MFTLLNSKSKNRFFLRSTCQFEIIKMTKIRKVKRRKKYRMNVNRKRLRNKLYKLPTITW